MSAADLLEHFALLKGTPKCRPRKESVEALLQQANVQALLQQVNVEGSSGV